MTAILAFAFATLACLAAIGAIDAAIGDAPSEAARAGVAWLGKVVTCAGASLFFLGVQRVMFPDFDIHKVIHGEGPFPADGEDIPRAAYILGWCLLYGAVLMAFSWGGAY